MPDQTKSSPGGGKEVEDHELDNLEGEPLESEDHPGIRNSWFGKPVEEVDPMIFDDTFCVVTTKFKKHYIFRYSCSPSLFLFGPMSYIRQFAICTTTHHLFDNLIIFTILLNCITLAMITNYHDEHGKKVKQFYEKYVNMVESGFLLIFTVEMVLKILAKGFICNQFSYMRNRWNMLDFIVVISGYVTLIEDELNGDQESDNALQFLRTFRVLRVVKTISIFPGLKMMINALLRSVTQLLEVMALTVVCLMIFSLFALEAFQGRLRQKCVIDKGGPEDPERLMNSPIETEEEGDIDRVWMEWVTDWRNWKRRNFPNDEPLFCGNGTDKRECGPGFTCIGFVGDNPDNGWTSFETFFNSMLSTFQLLTLDYWERLYDIVVSTCGVGALIFFLLVIFLGAYYLLNLMLAVVAMSYENECSLQDQGPLSATERLGISRAMSNFSFDELSKLNIAKMTHYQRRTKAERDELMRRMRANDRNNPANEAAAQHFENALFNMLGMNTVKDPLKTAGGEGAARDDEGEMESKKDVLSSHPMSELNQLVGGDNKERRDSEPGADDIHSEHYPDLVKTADELYLQHASLLAKCWIGFRKILRTFVSRTVFEWFITICIILNTIVLATEHHGETDRTSDLLKSFNGYFMGVFTFECVMKITALGCEYFDSGWNIFDLVIVILSFVDLIVSSIFSDNSGGSGLSVLRGMRLLRVFKLAHSWVTMKVLLNIIFSSFAALGNLTMVLLIILYIFAVMGMQVVGNEYTAAAFDAQRSPDAFPPWNWKHFWYAFMMVFRVLCGEWIEPLWDCLKAQGHHIHEKNKKLGITDLEQGAYMSYAKCFIIYLPILIVGNFIVLNLFLALLLNSFDTEELNSQKDRESRKQENLKNIVGLLIRKETTSTMQEGGDGEGPENELGGATLSVGGKSILVKPSSSRTESPARKRFKALVNRVILYQRIAAAERAIARMENHRRQRFNHSMANRMLLGNPALKSGEGAENYDNSDDRPVASDCIPARILQARWCCWHYSGVSNRRRSKAFADLYRWDRFRAICVSIVSHSVFEWTILFLIFASSITLAFEDIHLKDKPTLEDYLHYLNIIFTVVFLLEMVLKWFAIGIWRYFTSFWTLLDGFIVGVSLVSAYFDLTDPNALETGSSTKKKGNLGALKALRTLRALRPLRAISRWQGMKIVVNALLYAIPSIFNVLLVCLLFWLVFSIMGVQFFKGEFYRCVDIKGERVDWRLAPNKDVCCAKASTHSYSWVNTVSNYDNVFEGYLSLLQVATFEGWMELMSYSVDAVGVDLQPIHDYQIGYYGFYVIFIVFGSFFTLQLFIEVIIDNFNTLKKKYEGNVLEVLLTPTQRNYYIAMKNLGKKKPKAVIKRPACKYAGFFYDMAMSRKLEVGIFVMIFLNMVVAGFEYYGQGQLSLQVIRSLNAFFTTVYCFEALIKIVGLGFFYFTVPWNAFDFVLVGASLMDAFVHGDLSVSLPIPPMMLRIVRVIRIGRVLRLVKAAQGIRKLLFALVVSLPALFNIGALLALITFIYSILGMALFGRAPRKWSVDDVFNFETFRNSNLMLLRLMTAAGWNEVLDSLTDLQPVCGSFRHIVCGGINEPECPNRALVVAYIVTYLILTYLIVINLYIAIILENYVEASNEEDVGIVEDDIDMFYNRWARFDPYATQFIDFEDVAEFLDSLDQPLQIPKPNVVAIVAFNLPISRGNKIHCLDILQSLITHVLGQVDDTREFRKLQSQMSHKFQRQFPSRRLLDIVSSTRRWKTEQNAAIIIQRAARRWLKRRHPSKFGSKTQQSVTPAPGPTSPHADETPHGGMGHMMFRMGNSVDEGTSHKKNSEGGSAEAGKVPFTTMATQKKSTKKVKTKEDQLANQESDQPPPKVKLKKSKSQGKLSVSASTTSMKKKKKLVP